MAEQLEESKIESIKSQSRHLRGTVSDALADGTSHFGEENVQVLKFHGVYQQDDRDGRTAAKREGREREYSLMIRARIPGGVLTPEQYLQFDRLADLSSGTLRITTRQTFQLHGVLKGDLKHAMQEINAVLLTTLGGCGDQVRNIICCADPTADDFHQQIRSDLLHLVDRLGARTKAYHEIWIDGEAQGIEEEPAGNEEPLYGEVYLPRKFKLGFTVEGDNCADIYANDIGIVAHRQPDADAVAGYTLLVGGGMGRTAAFADTYPRLATPVVFVKREELVDVCTEMVKIQRDFGNRTERRYARFKYLLDSRGLDWFLSELAFRLARELQPARTLTWQNGSDHLGWHEYGQDRLYLGLFILSGRIKDEGEFLLKSALQEIVQTYALTIRLTQQQNLLLCDIKPRDREVIETRLRMAGVQLPAKLPLTRLHAMACPALPTCGLATAESERVLPEVLAQMDALFEEIGLTDEAISIRMTGCPNGCARPYIADIGFVGRTIGKYDLFLGGDLYGEHLNQLYQELVPLHEFAQILRPLLQEYKRKRHPGERFGAYCRRVGLSRLRTAGDAALYSVDEAAERRRR